MAYDPQHPPRRQILDDDGATHAYTLIPFSGSEGWQLAVRLFAIAGAPLGSLLSGGSAASIDLGAAVRDLTSALLASDSASLVKLLLRNATRDGASLDNPANFDRAFQANFGELAEALVWTVEVNGFVRFFGRLLTAAGGSLPGLASRFQPAPGTFSPGSPTVSG